MHPRNQSKYQKALALRYKGKSYGEIKQLLAISKSTLSSWFKNLELPIATQKLLEEKGRMTREPLMEFNRRRTHMIQAENQKIKQNAFKEIHSLSKYELILTGVALYWAEGQDRFSSGSPRIHFANSNPSMITLFLHFLREIMHIPEERLKAFILIHPNIDKKTAIKFWSKITKIPQEHLAISCQISRLSQGKRPKNSLPYGTLHLYVNKRQNFFRIKSWIEGLKHQSSLD